MCEPIRLQEILYPVLVMARTVCWFVIPPIKLQKRLVRIQMNISDLNNFFKMSHRKDLFQPESLNYM